MENAKSSRRVVVIGFDGATFDLIKPWVNAGHLPNLARMLDEGAHGLLRSTIQPTTAPAWTSMTTGVNQGKHGLYDFVRRRAGEYNLEVTNGTHIYAPTIFDYVSAANRHVVALNIPYTYPPRPVNGVMVGGPFAPTITPELVHPPSFYPTLRRLAPHYHIIPDYNHRAPDPAQAYHEQLLHGIEQRERIGCHLLTMEPWDLFMVVFMATDEVQHTFWHCMSAADGTPEAQYRDAILQVYRRLDTALGRLKSAAEASAGDRQLVTLVVSDHGAGPFHAMINLNRWLAEHEYLHYRNDRKNRQRRLQTRIVTQLALAYRQYLPARLRERIRHRLGAARFSKVKEGMENVLLTANVDWAVSRAYALGPGGNIYINVAGREPSGCVPPEEYEALRAAIADALCTLRDPDTGELVVAAVHRRESLYSGPYLEQAPDLIVEWRDYGYWGRGRYSVEAPLFEKTHRFDFSEQPLTGSHRPDGILIAGGDGVRRAI